MVILTNLKHPRSALTIVQHTQVVKRAVFVRRIHGKLAEPALNAGAVDEIKCGGCILLFWGFL